MMMRMMVMVVMRVMTAMVVMMVVMIMAMKAMAIIVRTVVNGWELRALLRQRGGAKGRQKEGSQARVTS